MEIEESLEFCHLTEVLENLDEIDLKDLDDFFAMLTKINPTIIANGVI